MFRKPAVLPSSGKSLKRILLGLLHGTILCYSRTGAPPKEVSYFYPMTEVDPASETSF